MKAKTCWLKGKHVTPQRSGFYEQSTPKGSHVYRIYRQGNNWVLGKLYRQGQKGLINI